MPLFRFLAFLFLAFFTLAESKDYAITYHGWDALPTDLSDNSQSAQNPEVSINAAGQVVVVWQRSNGSKLVIQSAYSKDNGNNWSTAADLSEDSQNAAESAIAINASGRAIAVWQRSNGSNTIIQSMYSPDGGVTWSSVINLSATGQSARDAQIAINASGRAIATWLGGGCALKALKKLCSEMSVLAKHSQQLNTESCVVDGNKHGEA